MQETAENSVTEELVADFAPEFTKNLASCTVIEGQPAFLECRVKGEPAPTVEWYKGDKKLHPDGTLSIQSTPDGVHRLIITKTSVEDSCIYKVKISNVKGTMTQEAKITVEGEEQIDQDFRHKIESTDDGRQKLTVENALTEDMGHYICKATNVTGFAQSAAELLVKTAVEKALEGLSEIAPEFIQPLENTKVGEGQLAVLQCVVDGRPPPEVLFYKGDQKLTSDEKHKVQKVEEGVYKLVIFKADGSDIGEYKAVALNVAGKKECKARLDVKCKEKKNINQKCEIIKREEGHIKKEGRREKNKKEHEMKKMKRKNRKGEIRKENENENRNVDMEKRKTRMMAEQKEIPAPDEEAPEFVKHLTTCTVNIGDVAVLECKIKGEPTPEIHWFKNGKEVKIDVYHRPDVLPDGRAKLTIDHATELDVGSYTVEVTNKAGKAVSEGKLIVKIPEEHVAPTSPEAGPLPEFSTDLSTYKIQEGQPVTLECKVAQTQPQPDVSWYKGEEKLETSQEHKIISAPDGRQALTITQSETSDSGAYSVEIKVGQVRSTTDGYLEVSSTKELKREGQTQAAPEFVEILRTAQCSSHGEAVFQCKISGLPKPEVKWSKDGEQLFPSDTVIMESSEDGTHKLILKDVVASALGEYRCDAANTAGAAWSEAPLVLKSARQSRASLAGEIAPDFLEPLRAVVAEEGQEVGMVCKVIGVPAPEVKWFKNGEPLREAMAGVERNHWELTVEEGGVHKLLLHNVSSTDVAEYRCQATNDVGIVWSDATLTLKEKRQKSLFFAQKAVISEKGSSFLRERWSCWPSDILGLG
uniref:Ig-like domain-containing protein n=1 Tax=Romanomermis culicivorax TaxID=13658 RepID=A0A915KDP4_ROMCU